MTLSSSHIRKLVYASLCLALALVLPFLTGQIPEIGSMLCPMHIPVLLAGFLCGWPWGLAIGAIAPVLRSVIFYNRPPMYPTALSMMFELAAYGFFAGLIYKKLPKNLLNLYISLVASMILGRIVLGAAKVVLLGIKGNAFTFSAFITDAVINSVPGIIIQLLLIPPIVLALRKNGHMLNK